MAVCIYFDLSNVYYLRLVFRFAIVLMLRLLFAIPRFSSVFRKFEIRVWEYVTI